MRFIVLLCSSGFIAAHGGCADSPGGADAATETTPAATALLLEGSASGRDPAADRRVECTFGGLVDQLVPDGDGGFSGFISGEVFRNMFPDTRRFEFQALVAGPVTLVRAGEGFELRAVGDQPDDAKPFWQELEVLGATSDGAGGWRGSWTCAPIDVDFGGYLDDGPSVPGTFTLVPQNAVVEPSTLEP